MAIRSPINILLILFFTATSSAQEQSDEFRCEPKRVRHACSSENVWVRDYKGRSPRRFKESHHFKVECEDPCGNVLELYSTFTFQAVFDPSKSEIQRDPSISFVITSPEFIKMALPNVDDLKKLESMENGFSKFRFSCYEGEPNSVMNQISNLVKVLGQSKFLSEKDRSTAELIGGNLLIQARMLDFPDQSIALEEKRDLLELSEQIKQLDHLFLALLPQRSGNLLGFRLEAEGFGEKSPRKSEEEIVWIDAEKVANLPSILDRTINLKSQIGDLRKKIEKEGNPYNKKGCAPFLHKNSFDELNGTYLQKKLGSLQKSLEEVFKNHRADLLYSRDRDNLIDPSQEVHSVDVEAWNTDPSACGLKKEKPKAPPKEFERGLEAVNKANEELKGLVEGGEIVAVVSLNEGTPDAGKLLLNIKAEKIPGADHPKSPRLERATWTSDEPTINALKVGDALPQKIKKQILDFVGHTTFDFEYEKEKCSYQSGNGEVPLYVAVQTNAGCKEDGVIKCSAPAFFSLKHKSCKSTEALELKSLSIARP